VGGTIVCRAVFSLSLLEGTDRDYRLQTNRLWVASGLLEASHKILEQVAYSEGMRTVSIYF
jgi:hypothetical protein